MVAQRMNMSVGILTNGVIMLMIYCQMLIPQKQGKNSFYPCCYRGWRELVFIPAIITMLFGIT